ncbi:hypothetical protein [Gorillibacterium sp. sgz5001074]|uniref:hypothetical protein n=1 Tax=Gorillibacterium sp. sgz5001074 TaxID=3446695 RepID=UPI003F6738CA
MGTTHQAPRYPKAAMSVFTLNIMQIQNPFVVMWWSAAIPGFGHLMLGKYIQGFILVIWELYTNYHSHLNESIFYSMVGDFSRARDQLNTDWLLLYVAVYVFTIWDSCRRAIMLNQVNMLAEFEHARVPIMKMNTVGIHVLNRYRAGVATLTSLLMPGLGQIYLQRMMTGGFILVTWVIACSQSRFLTAIHHTCVGQFALASGTLDVQWGLFLPSLYVYAMYDAYHTCNAVNNLLAYEQRAYLTDRYHKERGEGGFLDSLGGSGIGYAAATYRHSLEVEVVLIQLEQAGFSREALLVLPLAPPHEKKRLIHGYFYLEERIMNLAFPLGTVFMLLGVIYGFVLPLGPVLWGLFGLLLGFGLGLLLGYMTRHAGIPYKKLEPEVVIVAQGERELLKTAMEIFGRYTPIRAFHHQGPGQL